MSRLLEQWNRENGISNSIPSRRKKHPFKVVYLKNGKAVNKYVNNFNQVTDLFNTLVLGTGTMTCYRLGSDGKYRRYQSVKSW